jgi:hypothetical protein
MAKRPRSFDEIIAALSPAMGKAYSLCTARGFFNIRGVTCDCNQRNAPGAPWEWVATATCKK